MQKKKKIELLEDNTDEYLHGLKLGKNFKYTKKYKQDISIDLST